ncbi:MAG TPA: TonB-dependent receptor, partial [Bacteroidales bacterium]|nr:TonB-dependent receptor [Bacteroidales bacterium]
MKHILLFILLFTASISYAQKYTISGYVKDASTGEVLIGASIFIVGTNNGTFTNYYGFYSISLEKGNYQVEYSYLGYTTTTNFINLTANKTQNIELSASVEKLQTVVVSAEARDKNVSSTEMGTQALQMAEIKNIPVLFGENDVLKTIQLMPGVKSAGEGNSGFFVRGGGADQNLVLLDEAPVYNASHMLGFFSVFNGDAIRDVKLYKGNMPAEYGGRLSSVLDIKMKEGNMKSYHATGGIGLISSRLAIEGPIIKDTSSFIIAARRTYADMFLVFAKDTNLKKTKLFFYDLNLKTNYTFNENNRLFVSGYFGRDIFKFQEMFGTDWGNATGTVRWVHLFSPKIFLNSTFVYSSFDNVISVNSGVANIDLKMGINDISIKEDFQWYANTKNTVKFGFESIYHTFNPGELTTDMEGVEISIDRKYALETGLYISNEQSLNDFIKLKYGVRFSTFNIMGPGTTFTYNDDHEITDSAVYTGKKIIKSYPALEPRFAGTFRINASSSIKAAYTRNNQYVHLIQSSTVSLPMDYWIPSTELTPPQICSQYSLGYFRNFKENIYESSIEIYYKDLDSQIDYENGTNVFLN